MAHRYPSSTLPRPPCAHIHTHTFTYSYYYSLSFFLSRPSTHPSTLNTRIAHPCYAAAALSPPRRYSVFYNNAVFLGFFLLFAFWFLPRVFPDLAPQYNYAVSIGLPAIVVTYNANSEW